MRDQEVLKKIAILRNPAIPEKEACELIYDAVVAVIKARGGRPTGPVQASLFGDAPTATRVVEVLSDPDVPSEGVLVKLDLLQPVQQSRNLASSSDQNSDLDSSPSGLSIQKSESNRELDEPLPPGFAAFWAQWPRYRKAAKPRAIRAWKRGLKEGWLPSMEIVMTALIWQCERWDELDTPTDKIPHPATWINDRRWADEKPVRRAVVNIKHHQQNQTLRSNHEYLKQRAEQMKAEAK